MKARESRTALQVTWGLAAALAVVQAALWIRAGAPRNTAALALLALLSGLPFVIAGVATLLVRTLGGAASDIRREHRATLDRIGQIEAQNAMLHIVARSFDVSLAFQALADRIAGVVPCDRVGLALLADNGEEFQTYTARTHEEGSRRRPRPEVVFKAENSALGSVVRAREPLIINDTADRAHDLLDINVIHSAGFGSVLMLPLLSKDRAVGTLNVVSRQTGAFEQAHVALLRPIAEIFAVAYVAQQLQLSIGKYQTMEAMSELMVSVAADINSALQTIVGHCDLLERGYPDPNLQKDLATVVNQAHRISALLDKMRKATAERMRDVGAGGVAAEAPPVERT